MTIGLLSIGTFPHITLIVIYYDIRNRIRLLGPVNGEFGSNGRAAAIDLVVPVTHTQVARSESLLRRPLPN